MQKYNFTPKQLILIGDTEVDKKRPMLQVLSFIYTFHVKLLILSKVRFPMIRPYSRQKNFFLNVFRSNKESEMNTQTVSTIISHYVKEHLQDIPTSVVDISLVGSFSGIYGWKDTRFGDADISIICSDLQDQGFGIG